MATTQARFFDGLSIAAQAGTVENFESGIKITTESNVIEWSFCDLILIESPHQNKPCILGNKNAKGARLIIEDTTFYHLLKPNIKTQNIKHSHVSHPWRKLILASILVFALFGFALWGVPHFAGPISKIIPHSWDNALGQYVITQMAGNYKNCIDKEGVAALDKIVNKLTQNQSLEHPVSVKVIDMDDVNAFTVPGFHIVIMKGLIDSAKSPDEVTGVLAHEMAHAIEHHPTAGLIAQLGVEIIIHSAFGSFPDIGINILNFTYSRKNEFEADAIGVKLLNEANISGLGLVEFFDTIKDMQGDEEALEFTVYLSTHPATSERITRVKSLNKQNKFQPSLNTKEWKALQNICREKAPLKF